MATVSNMVPLGTTAPYFDLLDVVTDEVLGLNELKSDIATVVMFICNHCPYVRHIQKELVRMARDYQEEGVSFIAISSNDIDKYPEDSPQRMKEVAKELNYPFPYLFDGTQEVARSYRASCTPDFFVYDKDLRLVYRGQFDESRPDSNIPISGSDLRRALDCAILGRPAPEKQIPSMGCSIKWRPESTGLF